MRRPEADDDARLRPHLHVDGRRAWPRRHADPANHDLQHRTPSYQGPRLPQRHQLRPAVGRRQAHGVGMVIVALRRAHHRQGQRRTPQQVTTGTKGHRFVELDRRPDRALAPGEVLRVSGTTVTVDAGIYGANSATTCTARRTRSCVVQHRPVTRPRSPTITTSRSGYENGKLVRTMLTSMGTWVAPRHRRRHHHELLGLRAASTP